MILDAFYTILRADTRPLVQGMDEAKRKTKQTTDGLRETEQQAKRTSFELSQVAKGALAWLTATVSIAATARSSLQRLDDVDVLAKTSRNIGSAIEDVDAFRRVVQQSGGDQAAAVSSLTAVYQSMGRAVMDATSGQATAFNRLGVSVRNADGSMRGTTDVVRDMASALQTVEKAQARIMLGELGISDERTVDLLLRGRAAMDAATKAQKEQGVVTAEMAEKAQRLAHQLGQLRSSFDRIKMAIDAYILPALEMAVQWLQTLGEWVGRNQRTVTAFFIAIAGVLTAMYLPAMIAAAAATLAATWPILAIGAAIMAAAAAFALIYDDIQAFIAGNDSMIGQIFSKYPGVEKAVMMVVRAYQFFFDILKQIGTFFADVFSYLIDKNLKLLGRMYDGLKKFLGLSGEASAKVKVEEEHTRNDNDNAEGQRQTRGNAAGADVAMPDTAAVYADVQHVNTAARAASASPLNSVTSNVISNRNSAVNETSLTVGEINIQTQATDAEGIARDTRSELQGQLENMGHEFSSGVAR